MDNTVGESTFIQLIHFGIFMCSLILLINNLFDMKYKYRQILDMDDNIPFLHDIVKIFFNVTCCYFSISTPFDVRVNEIVNESLMHVFYLTSLLYTSTTMVTNDPSALIDITFDLAGSVNNVDVTIDNGVLKQTSISSFSKMMIEVVSYSKGYLILVAFVYCALIIRDHQNYLPVNVIVQFSRAWFKRLILLTITLNSLYVYLTHLYSEDRHLPNQRFVQEVHDLYDSDRDGVHSPSFQVWIEDCVMITLLSIAGLIVLIYEHYEFALVPLIGILTQNLTRMSLVLIDDEHFDRTMISCFIVGTSILAKCLRLLDQSNSLEKALLLIPKTLYKIGHVGSILALFILFISYTYDWLDIEFNPKVTGDAVYAKMAAADDVIDDAVDGISNVLKALNPCYRTRLPSTDDSEDMFDVTNINNEFKNRRKSIFDNKNINTNVCILDNSNYDFSNDNSATCKNLKNDMEEQKSNMITEAKARDSLDTEYADRNNDQAEDFIDEGCKKKQCDIAIGVGVTTLIMAAFPFTGLAAVAFKVAARAARMFFKIGKRIAKKLSKIRRKKSKLYKLARRLKKIVKMTKNKMFFTRKMLLIFFPVVMSATVSLVLIMFKREFYKPTSSSPARTERISKISMLIFGLSLPTVLAEGAFLIMLYFFPELINLILGNLPDSLIEASVEQRIGYDAIIMSYLISFLSNLVVFSSHLIYVWENTIFGFFSETVKIAHEVMDDVVKTHAKVTNGGVEQPVILHRVSGGEIVSTKTPFLVRVKRRVLHFLLNWNTFFFQPLLFSAPAIYILYSLWTSDTASYYTAKYSANSELTSTTQDLNDNDAMAGDMDDVKDGVGQDDKHEYCGLEGAFLMEIMGSLPSIDLLNDNIKQIIDAISGGFEDAKAFISELQNIIDLGSISIDVPPLFGSHLIENIFIYIIPLVNTGILAFVWAISIFWSKCKDVVGIYNYVNNQGTTTTGNDIVGKIIIAMSGFIFSSSMINIFLHMIIGNIVQMIMSFDMPMIEVDIQLGDKHYGTILASVLNVMSVIVIYVNTLIPPN